MPGEFIPIFEQNGFILKMDEYIFESVCKFLYQRIIENLPNVPISINISRLHLYQDDFIERYSKIKNKYSLPDKLSLNYKIMALLVQSTILVQVTHH